MTEYATILNKLVEVNNKTNSYVKLMNSYPEIVEKVKLYYTNEISCKINEFEEFKNEMNVQKKQQGKENERIMNKINYLNSYAFKFKNNFKEYQILKKNL